MTSNLIDVQEIILPETKQPTKRIRTRVSEIWLDDFNILRVRSISEEVIDLEEVKSCFQIYESLGCKTGNSLQILYTSNILGMTRDAREYVGLNGKYYFKASAIVGTSLATRIIINFFRNFFKDPVQLKLFRTDEEALEWLLSLD